MHIKLNQQQTYSPVFQIVTPGENIVTIKRIAGREIVTTALQLYRNGSEINFIIFMSIFLLLINLVLMYRRILPLCESNCSRYIEIEIRKSIIRIYVIFCSFQCY